ncbi:MAG: hypothetical protein HOC74_09305 [Gemmatimonadetes bacterium]|nr:hypothetical protein [Gemmatimonadota bacterium]
MLSEPYGWAGKILRVDLSTGKIETEDTQRWGRDYLGGRGLAARIAWDELPQGIGALDPQNPLMFFPGILSGTPSPSSGRTSICGLSPQAHPFEWFTRANIGGHWGTELKYAGYDGLIVTGQADRPVYLWIEDDQVELRDASHVWGKGIMGSQQQLLGELGKDVRILTIGQAGENLCRIAIIATETESAAGQGGFGAVMGAKQLKAIAVRGHGGVPVADSKELLSRCKVVREVLKTKYSGGPLRGEAVEKYGQKRYACTQHCGVACVTFYDNVPGVVHKDKVYRGQFHCCSPGFPKAPPYWDIGFEAGFEVASIANDYGLNHWEFRFGIGPWIYLCQQRGELMEIDGDRVDLNDPHFWVKMLEKMTFRDGWGDTFAEGGRRIPEILGIGEDLIGQFYPAWGHASHWDGHGSFGGPAYPYWLVTGLQWAMDTRDPLGGGHGYTTNITRMAHGIPLDDKEKWEKARQLGEHIYGSAAATDPFSGYEGKAHAATYHCDMNPLKDALGICDNIFPLLVDLKADDLMVRTQEGLEGRFLEHYVSEPALGLGLSPEEFYRIGTRIFTLERALQVRDWGRNREMDETIIPYLVYPEVNPNPFTENRESVDPEKFRQLMDEYYDLRDWDRTTGWPTRPALEKLGMEDIADGLERCEKLPEEVAV